MTDMNHLVCPVSSLSGSDVSQHGWDPPVNTDLSFLYKTFETLSSILSSFKVSVKVKVVKRKFQQSQEINCLDIDFEFEMSRMSNTAVTF